MFRRGSKPAQSAADAERQALFEKLAERPETVCPFLGLAQARADYEPQATDEHRCYAFGDPEPVSGEQQRNVCLQRGYANCPRYLRGVLVIPTDELEALRRPPQKVPPPPPPPPPAPASGDGGVPRRALVVLLLLLLLVGGLGAVLVLGGRQPTAGEPTPTPVPSLAPSASSEPSAAASEPFPSATADPTPEPGDLFVGYEVTVPPGSNDIFRVNDAGDITANSHAFFENVSKAPVDRVAAANGLLHWRVIEGDTSGWSYIRDQSGAFLIREVYVGSDGTLRYAVLDESET
jgi:hypothetical protein